MSESQSIILDCPPGMTRASDLLPVILEDTDIDPVEASSKMFGSCVFYFDHVPESVWSDNIEQIAQKIKELYARGLIRYGSWCS